MEVTASIPMPDSSSGSSSDSEDEDRKGQRTVSTPRRQSNDPYANFPKRERTVRGQRVGNKVIVDKGVPLPPQGQYKAADPSRSRNVRNSPRKAGSVQNRIDRSYTVSPLTEDERNAPHVDIPSHDEYTRRI
ncbi:hypothetical protein RAB80_001003 [Fusarium oxysporum f. sp. vasinfectum]|nr:hypothetical protein RAB80_001003 [Fusarium oxysporum f. sp. vasinfectum]